MPDYSSSKMEQSAAKNEARIKGILEEYRRDPNADPKHTVFTRRNAEEAKKFNILRYMLSKHSSTGRFGASHREEPNDAIKALDTAEGVPQKAYFDPFSLKIIMPKDKASTRDEGNVTRIPFYSGGISEEELARNEAERIRSAFISRVDTELDETEENDFEKSRVGHDSQMALAEAVDVGVNFGGGDNPGQKVPEGKLIQSYNSGRRFTPDNDIIEDIPDSFSLELIVDQAPPKYSQEWGQFRAEQTKGFWAQVKGFFKNAFSRKAPDEEAMKNELYEKFLLQIPEYRDTMNRNMAIARSFTPPQPYDPKTDPDLTDIRASVHAATKAKSLGHSVVRLYAKKYNIPLSSYSFLFGAVTSAGMAGAITGGVSNPPKLHSGEKKGEYDIRYTDYLKAAARIRGVVGSMRSYSIIGYNCTSFAVDVAHAAGIPLKDEDSSSYVMTHRHRSQRVDSPYVLAMHLAETEEREAREKNSREAQEKNKMIEKELSQHETNVGKLLNDIYRPVLINARILNEIAGMKLLKGKAIPVLIDELIEAVVKSGDFVDRQNPLVGLEGDALKNAAAARIGGRKVLFDGFPSEQDYLANLAVDDERLARLVLRDIRNKDFFDDLFGQSLTQKNFGLYCDKLLLTDTFNEKYGMLDDDNTADFLRIVIDNIWVQQNYLRNSILYIANKTEKYTDILAQFRELLHPFDPAMLGEGLFNSPQRIDAFIEDRKIIVPEPEFEYDSSEEEEEEAEGSEEEEEGSEDKAAGAEAVSEEGEAPAAEVAEVKAEAPKKSILIEEELRPKHVRELLISFDEREMLEAFIDTFKHSAIHIDGYNGNTGEDLKMADVLRVMARLTERDGGAKRIFVSYYSRIFNFSSGSDRLDLFKDMLQRMAEDLSISDLTNTFAECDIV